MAVGPDESLRLLSQVERAATYQLDEVLRAHGAGIDQWRMRRVDDHDRRRVLVFASPRGRAALAEWDAASAEVQQQFREVLGPDTALLDDLLRRLALGLTSSSTTADPPV